MRAKTDRVAGYLLYVCMAVLFAAPAHAATLAQMMADFGVQQPREHKPAPAFSLSNMAGERTSLSDARGKLVLLHFWATWCVPCRHEMPLLHALETTGGINGFRIVCVNVDRGNKDTVQTFIDQVTPHFHTLLDPDGTVRNHYAVRGLPTTYLIGPNGNIIGRIIGERDWSSPAMTKMLRLLAAHNAN